MVEDKNQTSSYNQCQYVAHVRVFITSTRLRHARGIRPFHEDRITGAARETGEASRLSGGH